MGKFEVGRREGGIEGWDSVRMQTSAGKRENQGKKSEGQQNRGVQEGSVVSNSEKFEIKIRVRH